jgi:energy-coupling factor transporter ATP-binding protein EcfA2
MVHAAGLAVAGRGLLVAGQSGAGKTTLALALLRAGFDFLADETVFLAGEKNALRILAFPDEADVTAQTLGFFPELHRLMRSPKPKERPKQAFCSTRAYGVAPCWDCVPEIIVFPQPAGCHQSILTPMPKAEALMQLVCNVVRTESRSSQAHLDALAGLVKNSRCFRLQTGRDFDRLPALLRSVMDEPADSRADAQ